MKRSILALFLDLFSVSGGQAKTQEGHPARSVPAAILQERRPSSPMAEAATWRTARFTRR